MARVMPHVGHQTPVMRRIGHNTGPWPPGRSNVGARTAAPAANASGGPSRDDIDGDPRVNVTRSKGRSGPAARVIAGTTRRTYRC